MLIEISPLWIVIVNCAGITAAHLGIGFWSMRRALAAFDPQTFPYRPADWENSGKVYRTFFRIHLWKIILPDGARWFDGFSKSKLRSTDPTYLRQFILETCRGEQSHWLQFLVILTFIAWTPFPASLAIISYAAISNIPCIMNLRQIRFRLQILLGKKSR